MNTPPCPGVGFFLPFELMFDFNSVQAPETLNKDFILSRLTDAQIFYYYFGKFDLKNVYPSKFHRDKNPSTGFYISKSGKIIYNHLNGREPKMDCFAFVQRLYSCEFKEAVKRIAFDFGLISGNPNPIPDKDLKALANFDRSYKKETKIHFKAGKWGVENLAYWKQFHITKDELVREGIYPIDDLFINEVRIPNRNNALRYALTVPSKDELLTKVYSPEKDKDQLKWVSNIPIDLPFGVEKLPVSAPFSFGSKAQKCRIVIMKFLPAVYATQNESRSALSPFTVKKLKFRYPVNYLGWDADEAGLQAMQEMESDGFVPINTGVDLFKETQIKDFSDLAQAQGLKAVEKLFKQYKLI